MKVAAIWGRTVGTDNSKVPVGAQESRPLAGRAYKLLAPGPAVENRRDNRVHEVRAAGRLASFRKLTRTLLGVASAHAQGVRHDDHINYSTCQMRPYLSLCSATLWTVLAIPCSLSAGPYDDGIPVAWRQLYFGTSFESDPDALAIADPDGDGANNYQEYVGGTDPSIRNRPIAVSTFAGSSPGGVDGFRTEATFHSPASLTFDPQGRLWITEVYLTGFQSAGVGGHRIRIMDGSGVVTTFSGSDQPGLVEGPVAAARYRGPNAVAFDSQGNVFVTDRLNHRIRKITPDGLVSTFAGSTAGYQDGPGSEARFHTPINVIVDAGDNLYVADFDNARIRKITPEGVVSTFAGSVRSNQDGPLATATFDSPAVLSYGPDGSMFVADWAVGKIRKISPAGQVSTFATGLSYIDGLSVDSRGNVYASSDGARFLAAYAPDGSQLWTLPWTSGFQDGPVETAKFGGLVGSPLPLPGGDFLVVDVNNHRLRRLEMGTPPLLTIAPGSSLFTNSLTLTLSSTVPDRVIRYTLDGTDPTTASPPYADNITIGSSVTVRARVFVNGNPVSEVLSASFQRVYAPDDGIPNNWRELHFGPDYLTDPRVAATADPDGDGASNYQEFLFGSNPVDSNSVPRMPVSVETFAGSTAGNTDGSFSSATFFYPQMLNARPDGKVYMTETYIPGKYTAGTGAQRIRVLDLIEGTVQTIAGSASPGLVEGAGLTARFRGPTTIVLDAAGNAYISDRVNYRIRKLDPDHIVSTLAGTTPGFQDGSGETARFGLPVGMDIDRQGNLYLADYDNHRIRKITPAGDVSTLAGGAAASIDGPLASARFWGPHYVAVAPDGTIYVAEYDAGKLRKITVDGVVTTFASGFSNLEIVRVDAGGDIYASAAGSSRGLYKYTPDGVLRWSIQGAAGYQDGPVNQARFSHFNVPAFLADGNLLISDALNHRIRKIVMRIPPLLTISPAATYFTNSLTITLNTPASRGVVRYTLDGSDPSSSSATYQGPITLFAAAMFQARVFVNNHPVSDIRSASYQRVYALNDGISAAWREQHFGPGYLTDPRVAADADPDGDGATNLQEFTAGSNPLDPLSGFRVGIRLTPTITWNSVPGEVYTVKRKDNLTDPTWTVVAPAVFTPNAEHTYVDLTATSPHGFYVVEPLPR